ncbi:MAG: bifunctional UDP-N-acetylmuramoyl-tripeptide:D-alanyl-D-alanine ligase/alanine racemase [Sediminibacterium sp.]
MAYTIQHIAGIIHADAVTATGSLIEHLLTDSRKIVFPETSLFFAIGGPRRDGHQFIPEVYERGVRHFVVRKGFDTHAFPGAIFLQVPDVLPALQQLAAYHRSRFTIPVIGITGSNGKTVVKEWLYQLLREDHHIVRSPRSYNSQIGVPLSIWQMTSRHTLGIFEAGISEVGEMEKLAPVIQPTIGIFTNLADAHRSGFESDRQKAMEKAKLFTHAGQLVFCKEALMPSLQPDSTDAGLFQPGIVFFSWSRLWDAALQIGTEEKKANTTLVKGVYQNRPVSITVPFTDRISVDNAITCWSVLLLLQYDEALIQQRMLQLEPVDMRMQLKKGINNCYLLNDSYSNDTASLDLAIEYLKQQAGNGRTTLILSDMLQTGQTAETLYRDIAIQLAMQGISRLIGIGPAISRYQYLFGEAAQVFPGNQLNTAFYDSTEAFLQQAGTHQFRDEYILLKGARVFEFERITHWLEQKVHQTVLEINLSAMIHNLKEYQKHLLPATRVMAMVKAFGYGSGSAEVARILQFHKVDYLAVAYADEGVELRKAGISLPIMVMNADEATFDALVTYDLEPEIYSFPIYHAFNNYLGRQGLQQFPVHIKFNTGMNRLGFEITEAETLCSWLKQHPSMVVKSVFSHLAGSETADLDGFTRQQVGWFEEACAVVQDQLGYAFMKHIANTAAVFRHPAYQFDMVRLGIGLYGVDGSDGKGLSLETVATLRSTIAQLRKVKAGDTVGYNRKGVLHRDSLIATVRIGYADGYSRKLGNGNGKVIVQGRQVPVVGNVCMDMIMIDVTDVPGIKEGDTVELFGKQLPIQELASRCDTIAYEIMTGVSQRVKRIYIGES